jgi:hypothetical protein
MTRYTASKVASEGDKRAIVRAVIRPLAVVLLLVGVARCGVELLVARPETLRFAREGRRVTGVVLADGTRAVGHRWGHYAEIGVQDPELGWQVVRTATRHEVEEHVELVCLTSARRCAVASDVAEDVARWPATRSMILGGLCIVGALALAMAARAR